MKSRPAPERMAGSLHVPKPFYHRDRKNGTYCHIEVETVHLVIKVGRISNDREKSEEMKYDFFDEVLKTFERQERNDVDVVGDLLGKDPHLKCDIPLSSLTKWLGEKVRPYREEMARRRKGSLFMPRIEGDPFADRFRVR